MAVLVAVIVLCFALFSNTQQAPTAPALAGTFQLVPAEYSVTSGGSSWEQHTVFLLDSKSGQVWEYSASGKTSDGKYHPAAMDPVIQLMR
jgi:hypothetical protein